MLLKKVVLQIILKSHCLRGNQPVFMVLQCRQRLWCYIVWIRSIGLVLEWCLCCYTDVTRLVKSFYTAFHLEMVGRLTSISKASFKILCISVRYASGRACMYPSRYWLVMRSISLKGAIWSDSTEDARVLARLSSSCPFPYSLKAMRPSINVARGSCASAEWYS